MILALSPANDSASAGAWIDGFLRDSGTVLLLDEGLWRVLDDWVTRLPADVFQALLPLLRRTLLGGGTDINQALAHCQSLVRTPYDTILVLISDLYEGGNRQEMLKRANSLVSGGVQFITLLALNDDGAPIFNHRQAEALAAMGIPPFACTPDLFPDLMASALSRQDMSQWAARNDIQTATSTSSGRA